MPTRTSARSSHVLLVVAYIGFVSLGLPDPLAGVAWPSVRETFSLSQSDFGLVFIALGCGYCASGFFGGTLTRALGLGNLLWASSGCVAIAMLGSGFAPGWFPFVLCAVLWGLGSGGIDAGLNSYVSSHFSARHVNWLHACYSAGATLGPILMAAMLVQLESWRLGYFLVGGLLAAMTVLFIATRHGWSDTGGTTVGEQKPSASMREALRATLVWFHIILFFIYVGVEFTVGQWSFALMTEARGVRTDVAGLLAGGYYGAIGIGRVAAGLLADRVGLDRLIRLALFVVVAATAMFAWGNITTASLGLVVIGLGLAPVFPCLMARTPQRMGAPIASHAVGFQVSAGMLGAALVPGIAGLLIEQQGLEVVAHFAVGLAILLFLTHEGVLFLSRSGTPAGDLGPVA